jgi:hypothetical protein
MHVDYTRHEQMMLNWVGFMPLTAAGMFVEIWPGRPTKENMITQVGKKVNDNRLEGKMVFIPKGVLLLVRGDTVHAGAMHCDTYKNPYGNPRLHIYVKNRDKPVVEEHNGNRWQDYDSEDVSDNDTDKERANRTYPPFDGKRQHAVCLGYNNIEKKGSRRNKNLSGMLFGEMKPKE